MTITLTPDKKFIDVSAYDADRENPAKPGTFLYDIPFNWNIQYAGGACLAAIKSSEWVTDPAFLMNWKGAGDAGLIRIAWHYFHPSVNAISQAANFIKLMNQAGLTWTGDPLTSDKVALDFENADGINAKDTMRAAASFYYEVHKALPQFEFVMYTGPAFWNSLRVMGADTTWVGSIKLWLATYPLDPTSSTKNPPPVFDRTTVDMIAQNVLNNVYCDVPLTGWKEITYRQITGHADSKQIPGYTGHAVACDVDVCFTDIPRRQPVQPVDVTSSGSQTSPQTNGSQAGVTLDDLARRVTALEAAARKNGWVV